MDAIRRLGLLGVCLALATTSARGSDPEGRPRTGLSLTTAEATEAFPSDDQTVAFQVPTTSSPPRPRTPASPPAERRPSLEAPREAAVPAPIEVSREVPVPARIEPARKTAPDRDPGKGPGGPPTGLMFPPVMIGDQAPPSLHALYSPLSVGPPPSLNPLLPPVPPPPRLAAPKVSIAVPWARGFKIADNQSPRPQDRVFFSFDYFNNLDQRINQRLSPGVGGMEAYRSLFGLEKTFADGLASIGFRLPLNSLSFSSRIPGIGGSSTAPGDLTVYSKLILLQEQGTGNLISGGLAVNLPTGPSAFAGAKNVLGFHDAQIQPFLGYIWSRGNFYVQGFEAIDVPTDPHDVTMQYNDLGIGYFLYRNQRPGALITAIVPTFETHINVPLNHRGAFRPNDPAGTPDVVDLTLGTNVIFQRSMLSIGFVNPVTGPRPFDFEWLLLYNFFFGRTQSPTYAYGPVPPVAGR